MKCKSDKACPFKQFSLKEGMECLIEKYPHLTVFCWEYLEVFNMEKREGAVGRV